LEVHLMTDMMSGVPNTEDADETNPAGLDGLDEQLINQLVSRAKAGGLQLTGEGGVLQQLTKRLLESRWPGRSPTTSAMTSTTQPAGTPATPATAPGRRPC
jgi:putative transposase